MGRAGARSPNQCNGARLEFEPRGYLEVAQSIGGYLSATNERLGRISQAVEDDDGEV